MTRMFRGRSISLELVARLARRPVARLAGAIAVVALLSASAFLAEVPTATDSARNSGPKLSEQLPTAASKPTPIRGPIAGNSAVGRSTEAASAGLVGWGVEGRRGTITATPNPIQACGSGSGVTTISWTATGVTTIEVHMKLPNGSLVASGGANGSVITGQINSSQTFYLQDTSGGLPLTAANTLSTVTVSVATAGCNCNMSLAPTNDSIGSGGGARIVNVSAEAGCSWTASTTDSFITITSGSGMGNGSISYLVGTNSGRARGGLITVAGPNPPVLFFISQLGGVQDPAVVGQWSGIINWPSITIHTHVLPNGKVLAWPSNGTALTTQTQLWDPIANTFTQILNPFTHLFCSGHAFLPDGRLLVAGGHHIDNGNGEPHTNIFDSTSNTWTRVDDMSGGRWYPTTTTLSNGEILVVSGLKFVGGTAVLNDLPEVWQTSGGWRPLTSAAFGLPLYPWMLSAPDGRVFNAGPQQSTRFFDTNGTGASTAGPTSSFGFRDYGSAVMYDDGKVLIMGGGNDPLINSQPTDSAEVVDLNAVSPAWRSVAPMAFRRRQLNATLLPDGKVLVTGGTRSPGFNDAPGGVFAAEMWDPATESWSTMASDQVRRLYHSTAVLLPDGRVVSGGGGSPAAVGEPDHPDVEIYSPPYLFKGTRPVITSAPTDVNYGQAFFVQTPDAAAIAKVTWIRLSSVTHSFNQNQRINRLSFAQASGGLSVTAPANGNVCPPGHYMLFILNGNGVPSVAKIVSIRAGAVPRTGNIMANPNPIQVCDGTGLGATTLSWTSSGTTNIEVHAGAPNGTLIAQSGPSSSVTTSKTVTNGTVFFLQDVSGGLPLTSANTLHTVTVGVTTSGCPTATGNITASPNPIQVCDGTGLGATTLSWTSSGTTNVEVHSGSPSGALVAQSGPSSSITTGKTVADGTVFFLQNVSGGLPLTAANTLGTVTVNLTTTGCGSRSGTITASPNPIKVCDGSGLGSTTLTWNSTGVTQVEVHMNAPNGTLVVQGGPSGTFKTSKNIANGTTFYLQDRSGGKLPLTAENTLATVTVAVTTAGCP